MHLAMWLGSLTALIIVLAVYTAEAAPFSWVGGTDSNDWTVGANWVGGTEPTFATTATNTDDLTFGNTANTSVLLGNTATEQSIRSIVFSADAPAYVISNLPNTAADIELRGSNTGAPTARLQNLSAHKQTINTLSTVSEYAMAITTATTIDAGSAGLEFGGDVWFGGNSFLTGNLGGDITIHGSIQGASNRGAQKIGVNTLFLTGMPTASAASTRKDVRLLIGRGTADTFGEAGAVRIDNNDSLQNPGSDTSGYTIIYGRNDGAGVGTVDGWNGRLELTNNITIGEFLSIGGRDGINAQAPSLWNFSGDNTLTGELEVFGIGPNLNFGSASGKLTFNNSVIKANNGTTNQWDVDHVLNWTGAGHGEFIPSITNTFNTGKLSLNVAGSGAGKLTISGFNSYSGNTTVSSGTLSLKSDSSNNSIPNSPVLDVQTSGTLDVTAFTPGGGFVVGDAAPQTLKGDGFILGNVRIASGSGLTVDFGSTGISSLNISGSFDITSATVDFNNIGGTLSAGTHVFAQFGSRIGAAFIAPTNVPAGFSIVYNATNIALTGAPAGLPGDFNLDNKVDAADYVFWRKNLGDNPRYVLWRSHFGAGTGAGLGSLTVPEPATFSFVATIIAALVGTAARRNRM